MTWKAYLDTKRSIISITPDPDCAVCCAVYGYRPAIEMLFAAYLDKHPEILELLAPDYSYSLNALDCAHCSSAILLIQFE